ncbi:MAG: ATP-binding protein [bacterium]|nr:ATP-binding protein [bacterium]
MNMPIKSEHNAVFTASIEELPSICGMVCQAAKDMGMADGNLWKLETAVDEACTNIACYGYKGRKDGKIWIRWRLKGDQFVIVIEDEGLPFDQTKPTHPDLSADICKRKVGGLGRFIMQKFMDEMHYDRKNDRNCLTLVKKLQTESGAED